MAPQEPPKRTGLSLYANLLDPNASAPGSISKAPVLNKSAEAQDDDAVSRKQMNAAALRFQPTKRPLLQQKQKPKVGYPRSLPLTTSSSSPDKPSTSLPQQPTTTAPAVKSTIADWTQDDDDVNGFYAGEKRQRGGRKKRNKKNKEEVVMQDWDDIYDPSRPDNYEEYKHSEEKYREVRDWKDRLYAHRRKRQRSISSDEASSEDGQRPAKRNMQFAPPSGLNFAPPAVYDDATTSMTEGDSHHDRSTDIDMQESGESAYARRAQLSQAGPARVSSPPTASHASSHVLGKDSYADEASPTETPRPDQTDEQNKDLRLAQPQAMTGTAQPDASKPRTILDRIKAGASISKAPILFALPPPPAELPSSEAELQEALEREAEEDEEETEDQTEGEVAARSNRPGQQGFAERLMAKYGYTKGSGLGAQGQGITTALKVKVEKRKKRPDAEGGGFIGTGGKGTIIGGKKNAKNSEEEGKFGAMSEVVVLKGMLSGIDVDKEMGEGLVEEIGSECGEKYGNVERVFVWREHDASEASPPVFVKFISQLSALRAVNALDGRIFNGNTIHARFFDTDRFEKGQYA